LVCKSPKTLYAWINPKQYEVADANLEFLEMRLIRKYGDQSKLVSQSIDALENAKHAAHQCATMSNGFRLTKRDIQQLEKARELILAVKRGVSRRSGAAKRLYGDSK